MAHIRQRRQGSWQATVRRPDGRLVSRTFARRHLADQWAAWMEKPQQSAPVSCRDLAARLRASIAEHDLSTTELGIDLSDWVDVQRADLIALLDHIEGGR